MNMKILRRLFVLSLLALGATACGDSSLLAPECEDPTQCEYIPDSGSFDGDDEGYIPDSGS